MKQPERSIWPRVTCLGQDTGRAKMAELYGDQRNWGKEAHSISGLVQGRGQVMPVRTTLPQVETTKGCGKNLVLL